MEHDRHSGPTATPEDREPRLGRFLVIKTIGKGGMGEVLKAQDTASGKYVALKILDGEAYKDPDLLKRFEREARSALSLDHVNIARFYGMERDHYRRPFIVMEYIEGESLDRLLKMNPDMPYSRIADFVIQTARGLESAFRRAIIHRDIKPSNLIVTYEDQVKIIDFGLAKSMWEHTMLTGTGMVVGTPRYISPEQAMGRSVDHRSDIYSLGATLYELLTRQAAFDGDTAMAIMLKHINSPLTPPYMINPKVPGDLNEITCRMLAKDPNERYQDYEPLIHDLESARIHRLSKEKRIAEAANQEWLDQNTVILDDPNNPVPPTLVGGGMPTSYLTDGLVKDVSDIPSDELPPVSRFKIYLALIAAVAVVAVLVISLASSPEEETDKRKPGWLSEKLHAWAQGDNERIQRIERRKIAADDKIKIEQTERRLDGLMETVLKYQRSGQSTAFPTVRQLRSAGAVSEEDSRDAWGHDFLLSGEGMGVLMSTGRDGIEGTDDDFSLTLDGLTRKVPAPLAAEEDDKKESDR